MTDPVKTKKKRSPLTWIVGGMVGVLILAALVVVGGTYIYIHFIEGPAPKPLTLPKATTPKHSAPVPRRWPRPPGLGRPPANRWSGTG